MNKSFLKMTAFASLLLLISVVAVQNPSAYAVWTNAPSFGGGTFHYADGLALNGKIFDISKYAQKITTQNLSVGKPVKIALKIFDNDGPTTIKGAAIFFNIRGATSSVSNSDTWIQYDSRGVYVHDPHHFLGNVTGNESISYPFKYVTFSFTPNSQMKTSDMGLMAWDDHYSSFSVLVTSAVSFS
ncbi:MAG TPA: hypothetical protein VJ792_07045 [Candidatus Nitrosotalea sp.]|nr:hypothetical protein [Candidatus Nitrosotalea sp.]